MRGAEGLSGPLIQRKVLWPVGVDLRAKLGRERDVTGDHLAVRGMRRRFQSFSAPRNTLIGPFGGDADFRTQKIETSRQAIGEPDMPAALQ